MSQINTICFDCETTGLNKATDEVLQLSILDENGDVLMNQYFKPEHVSEWPQAESVNHISPSMVKNCPTFREKISEINQIFSNADLIIGYNSDNFDIPFLKNHGIEIPNDKLTYDVMLNYSPMHGIWNEKYQNFKWEKLINCANHYNYQFNAHDSLEDTRATLFCFPRVREEAQQFAKHAEDKKVQAYNALNHVLDNVSIPKDVKNICSNLVAATYRDVGINGDQNKNGYVVRLLPDLTPTALIAIGLKRADRPFEDTKIHSDGAR